jgi:hypothetical protein
MKKKGFEVFDEIDLLFLWGHLTPCTSSCRIALRPPEIFSFAEASQRLGHKALVKKQLSIAEFKQIGCSSNSTTI